MSVQVPILGYGMTDLVYLQSCLTLLLANDPRLANTPVVEEVKFLIDSDLAIDILWQQPANAFSLTPSGYTINSGATGPVGAGIMVEMPSLNVNSTKVTGSPATWEIGIVCFEERNVNLLPGTGTLITAEQYAELCVDILQLQYIYQFGTLTVKTQAVAPANDFNGSRPGIVAWRASFEATTGRVQTQRSALVVPIFSGGNCTLTCADNAASVFYTTDLSAPVQKNINPNNAAGIGATAYTAPFAVTSGTTVLAASSKAGLITSSITGLVAP